jgi:hypothetical protein
MHFFYRGSPTSRHQTKTMIEPEPYEEEKIHGGRDALSVPLTNMKYHLNMTTDRARAMLMEEERRELADERLNFARGSGSKSKEIFKCSRPKEMNISKTRVESCIPSLFRKNVRMR